MQDFNKRLEKLERRHPAERGQRVERYTIDGVEYVQNFWNGEPFCRPLLAHLWDAWDEKEEA